MLSRSLGSLRLAIIGLMMFGLAAGLNSCKNKEEEAKKAAEMEQAKADSLKKVEDDAKIKAEEDAKKAAADAFNSLPEKTKTFLADYEKIATEMKELADKILNKDTDPTLGSKLKNKLMEATKKQGEAMLQSKTWKLTPEQEELYKKKFEEIKKTVEELGKAAK